MKRVRYIAGGIMFALAVFLGWSGIAGAHSFHSGDNVTLGGEDVIDETVFAAGRTIDISINVEGDVFCAGMSITISGDIEGDVICAGQNVNITGRVDGDVRLAGQTVTLNAEVTGNASVASQSFTMNSDSSIAGDLSVAGTDLAVNGLVGRDLAVAGESVNIAGSIGRNIKGGVDNMKLASSAQIAGDIEYKSNNELAREDGAEVSGEISRTQPTTKSQPKRWAVFGFGIGWFVYWFLAMLLTAMALVLLFPRVFHNITNRAFPTPWKALLVGFIAAFAVPVLIIVLMVTFIGLPLAMLLGFLWLAALLLSGIFFAYYIGRLVLPEPRHSLLIMLVGASILLVAYFIPIIGFLALLAATWIGTGMQLLEVFDRTPRPVYEVEDGNEVEVIRKRTRK